MTMRDIQAPPLDLYTLLVEVGPSTLVLVEGSGDRYILNEWYPEGDHNSFYYVAPGGNNGVVKLLDEVLTQTALRRAFGIIDRDFRSQTEVERQLNAPDSHLFIWPRYEIENYLLLPKAICRALHVYYGGRAVAPTEAGIEGSLLDICQRLCPIMAANLVCLGAGVECFAEGFPIDDRANLIAVASVRLGCSVDEAERRIAAEEALLLPLMASLDQAHSCTKGKHLLYQLHALYVSQVRQVRDGLSIDYLKRQLTSAVNELGLHEDIKTIIEQRVFA